MRKASYKYRLMSTMLVISLILPQMEPIFVLAKEGGISFSDNLIQEDATLTNNLIQTDLLSDSLVQEESTPESEKQTQEGSTPESEKQTQEGSTPESENPTQEGSTPESENSLQEGSTAESENPTQEGSTAESENQIQEGSTLENEKQTQEGSTPLANASAKATTNLDVIIKETKVQLREESPNNPISDTWGHYNDTKTLTIEATFDSSETDRWIEIELAEGIQLINDPTKLIDGRNILEVDTSHYTTRTENPTNTTESLEFKSGKIYIKIGQLVNRISLDLFVSIDERLYNTQANQLIVPKDAIQITSYSNKGKKEKRILDRVYVKDATQTTVWSGNRSKLLLGKSYSYVVRIGPSGSNTADSAVDRLYKEIVVKIKKPYTIDSSGNKIYATLVKAESDVKNYETKYHEDPVTNEIIFTFDNVYLSSIQLDFTFEFPSSDFNAGDIIYFEDGATSITVYLDQKPVQDALAQTFQDTLIDLSASPENVTVVTNSLDSPMEVYKDDNNLFHMAGLFYVSNYGQSSTPKKVRYDFPSGDSALVGAGTMRIIIPSGVPASHTSTTDSYKIPVTVELWNKKTNTSITVTKELSRTKDSPAGDTINLKTWRNMHEVTKEWSDTSEVYFKSIEYTIESFPSGFSSGESNRSVGQMGIYTLQYFNDRETDSKATDIEATMTITDVQNPTNISSATITPTFVNNGIATVGLGDDTEFKDENGNSLTNQTIQSGTSFYLSTSTLVSSYLYYSANFLKDVIFRVRIPEGVEIDFQKTVFTWDKNFDPSNNLTVQCVNQNNPTILKDGSRVYVFEMPNDLILGGINEEFVMQNNKSNATDNQPLYAKIYMTTRKNVKSVQLDTRSTISIDSKTMEINSGGSWHPHRFRDIYDVDQDGQTGDFIYTSKESKVLSIQGGNWIDSNLTTTINGSTVSSGNINLTRQADTFELKLSIKNDTSFTIDQTTFKYYFPVPRKDTSLNNYFRPGEQQVNLALAKEVGLTSTSSKLKVLYSTDEAAYQDPDSANYSANMPNDLSKVTMIKIEATQDLVKDDVAEITVTYKYADNEYDFIYDASNMSLFSPYGELTLKSSGSAGTGTSGIDTFSQVIITLRPPISKNPDDIIVDTWGGTGTTSFETQESLQSQQWQKCTVQDENQCTADSNLWQDITGSTDMFLTIQSNDTQFTNNGDLYRVVVKDDTGAPFYSKPAKVIVHGFIVTIPKKITLDTLRDDTASSSYDVKLQAQVPMDKVLVVEPDSSFQMTQAGKPDITGTVTQLKDKLTKTEWTTDELDPHKETIQSGEIKVTNVSAGDWSGNFNFTIGFKTK